MCVCMYVCMYELVCRHPIIPPLQKLHHPQNCIKSISHTLACGIHSIITDKNKKNRLNELHSTLHQGGYLTTIIHKGF